ncbi:hypothetical protein HF325_006052 [Metschnikowia pulcherrima]|uniref:PCI domain-containing protein n=1 Tax=Metschnikowia pulcherrima TaxID=27326 RepID=A0A8H7GN62_9ASCO|nr:hypothetical protein HF325_006052 [Metschnikowia pulcherrima]
MMESVACQAGPDLLLILSLSQDADTLLHKSQHFLSTLPCPYPNIESLTTILNSESTAQQKPVCQLLEVELNLYFANTDIDFARIEAILKDLSYMSTTNTLSHGALTVLMRIKYNDLLTDYHFVFSPKVKQLRLVDLVTKKIALLGMISGLESAKENLVIDNLKRKILAYYLLCESDHRKKGVSEYIKKDVLPDLDISQETLLFLANNEKLANVAAYKQLLECLTLEFYQIRPISLFREQNLLENYLDVNLSKLPRYFTTISLDRIRELLLVPENVVNIENLLYKMIISNKFPHGATIDQISGYVKFGEKPHIYNEFDTHIKKVCDTVDQISVSLNGQKVLR